MLRIVTFALFATALHAQNSVEPVEEPPAKVDQALRARVTQFYQDFVKGQFRDAESLVAPGAKEHFAAVLKEKYLSFEIKRIDYSEKFKLAQVAVVCEQQSVFEGFLGHAPKTRLESAWKLAHGKWYWYEVRNAPRTTPAGIGAAQTMPLGMMGAAMAAGVAPAALGPALHKVTADKESLALKAGESAAVTFSNAALGPMTVSLSGDAPAGIEVTPAHFDLPPNGKAAATVKALEGAKSAVLHFQVAPTGEFIAIRVAIE